MKFLLSCILFMLILPGYLFPQEYWIRQPSPTNRWFIQSAFTDTLNGWVAGDSGVIIHTSNGGLTWVTQNSGLDIPLSNIFFLNKRLGWSIANHLIYPSSIILKTTDGGNNWTSTPYEDTLTMLSTIMFLDSLTGFIGGQWGTILKTTDAGHNWNRCEIDTGVYANRTINKFVFYNYQYGFAGGGIMDAGGVVWKTTDFGLHWNSQYVSPEPVDDMLLIDSQTAIGSGGDFELGLGIVKTNNAGLSWDYYQLLVFGIGYSISSRTKNDIWVALGYGSHWMRTLDTGKTYQPIPVPDTCGIYDVNFIDSMHGWAFGTYGAIYKFNTSTIGIHQLSSNVPGQFMLYQNYPNPFNPATKIKFDIPDFPEIKGVRGMSIRLTIFDILGHEIATLVNTQLQPGTYEIGWNGINFPSGIYFYRLTTEDFSESKRMVLIK